MAAARRRKSKADCAPRPDARAVVAVGRRQDDAVAACCSRRIARVELSVSVTTRPKRRGEVDGRDYHFIDRARFDAMVKSRRTAGMGRSFRPLLRHAAPAGDQGACGPAATCCSISIGRAPSSCAKKRATISSAFSSCRRPSRNWSGGSSAGRRTASRHRLAHGQGRRRDEPLAGIRLRHRQSRQRRGLCRSAGDSGGGAAQARAADRPVGFRARLQAKL